MTNRKYTYFLEIIKRITKMESFILKAVYEVAILAYSWTDEVTVPYKAQKHTAQNDSPEYPLRQ